jgi:ferredoxin-thioredoxin reductase catalytic subunit
MALQGQLRGMDLIHEKRRAAKTWKKMVEQKNQSIPLSCPCRAIDNQKSVTRNQGKMVENKKISPSPLTVLVGP